MSDDDARPTPGCGLPSAQDRGGASDQDELALHLGDLARSLEEEDDSEQTLVKIVAAAVALIPGAQEGSISVVRGRQDVHAEAASSELPEMVDALQAETGQGPCMDAVFEQQTVRVADMATEERWPRFAAEAARLGAGSMLSFQLYVEGDNLGALNLYGRERGAFDDESEHVGLLFATHAAVALAGVQKQEQLRQAVATRDLIGMAKGVLIERHKVTSEEAFTLLVRASQDTNRKLREIAEELLHSGRLLDAPR